MIYIRALLFLSSLCLLSCSGDGNDDETQRACGGLQGLQCAAKEYCNFTDKSCGAADATGVCETVPQVCTAIYAPVCGCDGNTYASACTAAGAGMSIVKDGEC